MDWNCMKIYRIRFNFQGVKLSWFAIFQDFCVLIFAVVES